MRSCGRPSPTRLAARSSTSWSATARSAPAGWPGGCRSPARPSPSTWSCSSAPVLSAGASRAARSCTRSRPAVLTRPARPWPRSPPSGIAAWPPSSASPKPPTRKTKGQNHHDERTRQPHPSSCRNPGRLPVRTGVAPPIRRPLRRPHRRAMNPAQPPPVDPGVPSPARVWNVWLGGTDNFPVDRDLAGRIQAAMPSMPLIARFARLFLADAVRRLSELGIRQFLDIGSGVPTADNTHQVAQRLAPESRIVYADRDPIVARHAWSLLSSTREGKTDYLHADLRDPEGILDAASRTLDLTRSVGVLLIAVLHFIPDADDPYGVVGRLLAGLPSGSYLVVAHAASDLAPEAAAEMTRRNNQTSPVPITPRTQAEVTRFFDGLDLMPPGVVPVSEWDLGDAMDTTIGGLVGYAGIGRKP